MQSGRLTGLPDSDTGQNGAMVALAFVLALAASPQSSGPTITRDAYGVPLIRAASHGEAFFQAGYAVAQDRLWQMETSRRLARGKMAEVFGSSYVASDKEILQTGYTDEELQQQIDHLSPAIQESFREYARGVNAWIEEAKKSGLPDGYRKAGFTPEPWTVLDSAAISVRLLQQFGRGGAGEIRNMALLGYLQGQPKSKDKALDILDDFAWANDPTATTTIAKADDHVTPPKFYYADRAATVKHLAMLPKVGLLELMQGIRLASREESTRVAESVAAPFKTGSYCIVVSPGRSATGHPLLLSGPQMGFRTPSIIHEMSISEPGMNVVGMDIPGAPGIVIGHTQNLAWGMTSGVADTDDVFYYPIDGTGYLLDGTHRDFVKIDRTLHVKGGADQTVTQLRTVDGPVVLRSGAGKAVFVKKTSYWMQELNSIEALNGVWHASSASAADKAISTAPMSFNFFYALASGDIGYRYAGRVPVRADGIDPRFPTPGGAQYAWRGFVPTDQMPHVMNPKAGFLANWNNKPVTWWPNFDTPVWGTIFRNSEVLACLKKPKLDAQDLELTAWTIARTDETWPYFAPFVSGAPESLAGFDGRLLDGSRQATTYLRFIDALRNELFLGTTGNFITADNFRQIGQPSVMLKALRGRTRVNYLAGRKPENVVKAALLEAAKESRGPDGAYRRYAANGIPVPGQSPIPYSNRGSYIQVVEALTGGMTGRSILTPGVAESGAHSLDQVDLARAWLFKPMDQPWTKR